MKQLSLFLLLILVLSVGACKKSTCTDSSAPNFGAEGSCTDATAAIVGVYTGTFVDSIDGYGQTVTDNQTVTVTKVDASHIQVTPSNSQFFPFVAKVTASGSNYMLTITSGTYQGESYAGANTGTGANGSYNSGTKVFLSAVVIDGSTIEGFSGVKQ